MRYTFVDMTDESALLIAAEAASQQLRAGDNDKADEDKDADATLEQGAMDATTQDPCALDDITIDPDALPDLTRDPDVSELKAGSKDTSTAVEDPDTSTQDPNATLAGKLCLNYTGCFQTERFKRGSARVESPARPIWVVILIMFTVRKVNIWMF